MAAWQLPDVGREVDDLSAIVTVPWVDESADAVARVPRPYLTLEQHRRLISKWAQARVKLLCDGLRTRLPRDGIKWMICVPLQRESVFNHSPATPNSYPWKMMTRVRTVHAALPILTEWDFLRYGAPDMTVPGPIIGADRAGPLDCPLYRMMLLANPDEMQPCAGMTYENIMEHKADFPWENETWKSPGEIRWPGVHEPYFTESGYRLRHSSSGSVEEHGSNARKEWV